jgi:hypothetical protein
MGRLGQAGTDGAPSTWTFGGALLCVIEAIDLAPPAVNISRAGSMRQPTVAVKGNLTYRMRSDRTRSLQSWSQHRIIAPHCLLRPRSCHNKVEAKRAITMHVSR